MWYIGEYRSDRIRRVHWKTFAPLPQTTGRGMRFNIFCCRPRFCTKTKCDKMISRLYPAKVNTLRSDGRPRFLWLAFSYVAGAAASQLPLAFKVNSVADVCSLLLLCVWWLCFHHHGNSAFIHKVGCAVPLRSSPVIHINTPWPPQHTPPTTQGCRCPSGYSSYSAEMIF